MTVFDHLRRERASGHLYTLRDWIAQNPPADSAFTQTISEVARRAREETPFAIAVREFLDEFSLRPARLRLAALLERPGPVGDRRCDAYLAALAEHLALLDGAQPPAWSSDPERFLDRFWFVSPRTGFRALAIAESPAAFRRRGIFIARSSLERC